MTPTTADAVRNVIKDHKQGLGSFVSLCKTHGISTPQFYAVRKEMFPTKAKTAKRKYQKKSAMPAFVDVPLHTDHKVYIVTTSLANLRRVMESL